MHRINKHIFALRQPSPLCIAFIYICGLLYEFSLDPTVDRNTMNQIVVLNEHNNHTCLRSTTDLFLGAMFFH